MLPHATESQHADRSALCGIDAFGDGPDGRPWRRCACPAVPDLCQQDRGDQGGGGLRHGAGGWPAGCRLPGALCRTAVPGIGRDARADGDSREGRAGGRCSIRESTDRRRRAQRWRGDRPGSQSGGGETGRGSHRERSRDGAADERARYCGDERLPARHCRGCRDSRAAVEPAGKPGGDGGRVVDGAVECRAHVAGSADLGRRPGCCGIACDQHAPSADGG